MIDPKGQFADISSRRLARVYAEALLNAAESANAVEPVLEEIDSLIDDVLSKDARLYALLAGAAVGRKTREYALQKVFAGRATPTMYTFLRVLNDHDRLDLLGPIRITLHELHEERARRVRVYIHSATALPEGYLQRLREILKTQFKLDPVLEAHVDRSLLGGMKMRIGDKVYDATVRTKIDNLRNQLIARSSHEIQSRRDRFSTAE